MAIISTPNYDDLSSDGQEFIKKPKVADSMTIEEWLKFFGPLAMFDKRIDSIRQKGNYIMALWAFWIVFGMYMLLIFMFNHAAPMNFIAPAILIVAASLLLYVTDKFFDKYESKDVPNLLRGFLVPFLELLKKRYGDQVEMKLDLDLKKIGDLEDIEAYDNETDKFNYLSASMKLEDSTLLNLTMDAKGVSRPLYSYYKLKHYLQLEGSYDSTLFQVSADNDSLQISENGNQIVIKDTYKEQSDAAIEADTGPDLYQFARMLSEMRNVAERKA